PHRNVHGGKQIRQGADVVLVAVRQEHAAHPVGALDEPGEIRMHDIHAEVIVGELHAAVDDEDVLPLLDRETIHAHLAEAAEGDEADPGGSLLRYAIGGHGFTDLSV